MPTCRPTTSSSSSPDQLYSAALSIWQFAAQRKPGTARVRVYHPQLDEHGWQSGHTVVEIVNDDMPFLVDSVTAELNRQGLTVHLVIHPVVRVRRDASGQLTDLYEPQAAPADAVPESFMHIEVDEQTAPELLEQVAQSVEKVLTDVRYAVEDWQKMRTPMLRILETVDHMPHALPDDEVSEARDFLLWLNDDNFTFLGYRRYRFEGDGDEARLAVVPGEGMGILRDDDVRVFDGLRNFASLPPDAQQFLRQPRLLLVTKSNRRATVHRPALMDSIFIKEYDDNGLVVGEHLFVGLFTSVAYNTSARDIPYLRNKVVRVLSARPLRPAQP